MTKPTIKTTPTKPPVSGKTLPAPSKEVVSSAKAEEAAEKEAAEKEAAETREKKQNGDNGTVAEDNAESTSDQVLKHLKEVFATHTVDEVYLTSDGTCFIQQQYAVMHGETLPNSIVTPIKRSEV